MLPLRDEHLNAFSQTALGAFEVRALAHLRKCLPDETQHHSDAELRARVRACLPRAKRHGLTTQRQLMAFVDTSYLSQEDFDVSPNCPWAAAVLDDREIPPDLKSQTLLSFAHSAKARHGR